MASILGTLALVLALGLGAAALVRPVWAVVLLLMMWPIEQVLETSIDIFAAQSSLFNAYVALVVAAACVVTFLRGKAAMPSYFNAAWILAVAFYAWAALSLLWTRYPTAGNETASWLAPYIIVAIIGAPICIRNSSDLGELRWGIMGAGSILATIILLHPRFSFYGDRAFVQFSSTERGNPLAIATLGASMIVFSVLSRDSGVGRLFLPLRVAAMVLGISLAVMTGSRGQLLAGIAVGLLLFPTVVSLRGLRPVILTMLALPVVTAILWVSFFSFLSTKNIDRWSLDSLIEGTLGRVALASGALSAYLKTPEVFLTGFGTMSFAIVVPEGGVDFCENMFVEALTDLGLIGFGMLATLIYLGLRSAIRLRFEARDRTESVAATALIGIILVEMLLGAKSYNIWTGFMPIMLCVIACRIQHIQQAQRELEDEDEYLDRQDASDESDGWDDAESERLPEAPRAAQPMRIEN